MSCCGGNCGCGPACNCENGCGGCKMDPDLTSPGEGNTTETLIIDVAPQERHCEGAQMSSGCENEGCTCDPCTCEPCTCN